MQFTTKLLIMMLMIMIVDYNQCAKPINGGYIQTTPFVNANISNSMHIIGSMASNNGFGLCKSYKAPFKIQLRNNKTHEIYVKKLKLMPSVGYINNRLIYSFVPSFVSKYKLPHNCYVIDSDNKIISLISKPYEINCTYEEETQIYYNKSESTTTIVRTTIIQTKYIYTIACYTEHVSGEKYMFNNSLTQLNIILNKESSLEPVELLKQDEPTKKLQEPIQYGINITIYKGFDYNNNNNLINRVTIVGFNIDNIVHSVEEFYLKTLLLQKKFNQCFREINFEK